MEIKPEIVRHPSQLGERHPMEKSPWGYRLSHWAVRIIVMINMAHLVLSYYPPYFRGKFRFFAQSGDIYWMLASSLLIPLYVGFETWWMFGAKVSQKKALLIDWLLAGLWFVMLCAVVLRSLYRYYPIWP